MIPKRRSNAMTKQVQLDKLTDHLNKITNNEYDFQIEYVNGQPRLTRKAQSVDVSPRLSKSELFQWMHAFLDGMEFTS